MPTSRRKYHSVWGSVDFEKISLASAVNSSRLDRRPIVNRFLAYLFSRDFFVILEHKEK
jgi:hypothetical protein